MSETKVLEIDRIFDKAEIFVIGKFKSASTNTFRSIITCKLTGKKSKTKFKRRVHSPRHSKLRHIMYHWFTYKGVDYEFKPETVGN